MATRLIERLQEIESLMDEQRDKGVFDSKYEGMFVTALRNITKSKKASNEYYEVYGIDINEEILSYS